MIQSKLGCLKSALQTQLIKTNHKFSLRHIFGQGRESSHILHENTTRILSMPHINSFLWNIVRQATTLSTQYSQHHCLPHSYYYSPLSQTLKHFTAFLTQSPNSYKQKHGLACHDITTLMLPNYVSVKVSIAEKKYHNYDSSSKKNI